MSRPPDAAAAPAPQIGLALGAVFLVYLGQLTLGPVIAPLSRAVGLHEWQVGLTMSLSALCNVLASQFWGRRSRSWGRKPVLVTAMGSGAVTMALFALAAWLGFAGALTGAGLFAAFALFRGIGYGLPFSAVAPTVQAYIADVTPSQAERVRGMAGIGAVEGAAMVLGSVVGGLLAAFGLMVPLLVVPVLIAAGGIVIAVFLRRERRHELLKDPPRVSFRDPRVWPYLIAGFGMFTALGFVQILAGFLIQDRFGLGGEKTAAMTGLALLSAGVGMLLAQAVVVPRLRWRPARLMRVGVLVAAAGIAGLLPNAGFPLLFAAIPVIGFGMGLALPGYTAGPSLEVSGAEQGGVAGVVNATNGLSFMITPTLATAMYSAASLLPIVVGLTLMGIVAILLFAHPRFAARVGNDPEQ